MIRCPGCGALAQWGAPRCPACGATFAPPPTVRPLGLEHQLGLPSALPPATHRRNRLLLVLLAVGLTALAVVAVTQTASTGGRQSTQSSALAFGSAPASKDDAGGGIFTVAPQTERAPIVEIGNDSPNDIRIQIIDARGAVTTEWVQAWSKSKFTVQEGEYGASVDAPTAPSIRSASGSVRVKEYHHYEAAFHVGPVGTFSDFYIGD